MREGSMLTEYRSRIMKFNARSLLSLFYECYRQGVSDAADLCDENRCRQYVERMRNTHTYRLVHQDFDMMWKEWRLRMVNIASHVTSWQERVRRFVIDIDRYGVYYSVPLRAGMDFYVMGVEDYAKYPVHGGIELFLAERHMRRWKKGFENEVYRNADRLFADLQTVVFDRVRYDITVVQKKAEGREYAMTERTYMTFLECMYLCIYRSLKKAWWNDD